MTDREKVMAELTGLQLWLKGQVILVPGHEDWENALTVCTNALELLKEQEAVKPKQIIRKQCKKEHEDGSIDYFAEWYCPHCNMLILRGFDNPSIKFCYKCGKPILWESR